ncbi:hypothetical protein [Klebsiella quasipneumoniae]|uniref:hypothetical protein n=1 Tax=Klebsiella quasipneumoniae TaxID=1463165 RepID=UPI0021811941|nr:hypothetical protein [Klebsiella quasipneumoniae]GKQ09133.1 hypothetical protein NUKP79_28540 [Klebsiella quasipneumoniae]
MTSKFNIDNRELLQKISCGEAVVGIDFGNLIVRELAAFRLAAMDSEPVAYIFKHPAGRLFWALTDESNKGQSDVMPVYAAPQTAVDWESGCKERNLFCSTDTARMRKAISASAGTEAAQLYRHAQQPVVPDDVLAALQKVARIRLDLNDFDGDRRGIADCLGDAEEALIEVVNRRAVMLAAVPQEVKGE